MGEPLRICRKCLPGESEAEYFENLARYIERMDEDLKVDQQTYEHRLAMCRDCRRLMGGMCSLCGCFVQLRAVQKLRGCPDLPPKWTAEAPDLTIQ